jgi:hypothetical protein
MAPILLFLQNHRLTYATHWQLSHEENAQTMLTLTVLLPLLLVG